jgi:hypothetical protein
VHDDEERGGDQGRGEQGRAGTSRREQRHRGEGREQSDTRALPVHPKVEGEQASTGTSWEANQKWYPISTIILRLSF